MEVQTYILFSPAGNGSNGSQSREGHVAASAQTHAALRLHDYLLARHWDGARLQGPDVGIRFNARIGRFVKGYLPCVRWNDNYCYIQGQGYWILANWRLHSISGEEKYRELAVRCSNSILSRQRPDGAWEYPNPEWRGRVATAEGTWGSLGLLESYRQTGQARYLEGARRWRNFLVQQIGFQQDGPRLSVNYFQGFTGLRVPNNSALVLRFLGEFSDVSGEECRPLCNGLLQFLQAVQTGCGEFPYRVKGDSGGEGKLHFQCFQYNAYMCLDLMRYHDVTGDDRVLPLMARSLTFLRSGLAEDGHSYFDCGYGYREVTYHTAVLAHALAQARHFPIGEDYDALAHLAYARLLRRQQRNGGFPFSRRDYLLLSDKRSYPRSLAMILFHLLPRAPVREPRKSCSGRERCASHPTTADTVRGVFHPAGMVAIGELMDDVKNPQQ